MGGTPWTTTRNTTNFLLRRQYPRHVALVCLLVFGSAVILELCLSEIKPARTMMKSAEKCRRQDATDGMYCSRRRRVFVDRKMRASLVVVGRVRSHQMAKMPLAEHDNAVKTFPPDRTDRPFTISVLPRRSRRGWPIPNAHCPKAADEDVTVDGVAVTNDVSRCYFPTIGLGELVRNPFRRWVRGHSQPQDLAAICDAVSATRRAVGMRLSE